MDARERYAALLERYRAAWVPFLKILRKVNPEGAAALQPILDNPPVTEEDATDAELGDFFLDHFEEQVKRLEKAAVEARRRAEQEED